MADRELRTSMSEVTRDPFQQIDIVCGPHAGRRVPYHEDAGPTLYLPLAKRINLRPLTCEELRGSTVKAMYHVDRKRGVAHYLETI